jgi:hypothetical protein
MSRWRRRACERAAAAAVRPGLCRDPVIVCKNLRAKKQNKKALNEMAQN